jgi:hypothetical protein
VAGVGLAATVVAGAGLVQVLGAAPAFASQPGNCVASANGNYGGQVICSGNNISSVQVGLRCLHAGVGYSVYGPWVSPHQVSSARCNTGDVLGGGTPTVFYDVLV